MRHLPLKLHLPSADDEDRGSRIHVSTCIGHLLNKLNPGKFNKPIDADARIKFEFGFAWEEAVVSRAFWKRILKLSYPDMVFQQMRTELDGLRGTPDIIIQDYMIEGLGPDWIVECKWTEKSAAYGILDSRFWHWQVQMKAYCHMWDWKHALLLVCFRNGDYRPKKFLLQGWLFEFTDEELKTNWEMLLGARDEILAERTPKKKKGPHVKGR